MALLIFIFPLAAKDVFPPLPAAILEAKSVCIENQTGEAAPADTAYRFLLKWKRYRIESQCASADLRLSFSFSAGEPGQRVVLLPTPFGIIGASRSVRDGFTTIRVTSVTTGEELFKNTHAWNPKGATNTLLEDFKKRVGKMPK
ncbi:MAG: hypothetical protein NTZ98_10250 [Acidobacteria bacterium]|nr:hypothetical protein [Acidobacteriota bacterium]